MRITVLVLAIVGGLLGALLGMNWIAQYNDMQRVVAELESAGADLSRLTSLMRASYVLLAALVLGIAGGVMTLKGRGRIGGGLMLLGPLVAAVLAPQTLVGSFLLIIAGGLALLVKPARAVVAGLLLVGLALPSPSAAQTRDCTFRYKASNTWYEADVVVRADSRFRRQSSPIWKKLNQSLTVNAGRRDTRTSGDREISGLVTCPATMIFELHVACPAIGSTPAKTIEYLKVLKTKDQDYDGYKPIYDLGNIGQECGRPR